MAQKNDNRIMDLKRQIESKRSKLKGRNVKFVPVTNCLLTLDRTYNLHIDSSEMLLVRLNMIAMSVKDLGKDVATFMISGFSLANWIEDVQNYLDVQNHKAEMSKLNALEQQLDALLSDDKRTEIEIDSIESMII